MTLPSIKNMLFASACIPLILAAPSARAQRAVDPIPLWQGLTYGMTPEESLPALQQIEGVKRAKILKERKSDPSRRLDIDYLPTKIAIAAMPFEVTPVFKDGLLAQVMLTAPNQCGAKGAEIFEQLAAGLRSKYSADIGTPNITERDFLDARRKSRVSGEPYKLGTAFANDRVAVMLFFQVKEEAPPPYPTSYSKLGVALWNLLRSEYENRKAECSGTGDQRVGVGLIYLTRAQYDAGMAHAGDAVAKEAARLTNQL
ncbi:hypothetical protein [Sphingopyxis fribergensis]